MILRLKTEWPNSQYNSSTFGLWSGFNVHGLIMLELLFLYIILWLYTSLLFFIMMFLVKYWEKVVKSWSRVSCSILVKLYYIEVTLEWYGPPLVEVFIWSIWSYMCIVRMSLKAWYVKLKGDFDNVHAWCVLEGWNEYLEECV